MSPSAFSQCHGAQLQASDAIADDEFGVAVAVDGDLAVVGSPDAKGIVPGAGAAYVFQRRSTGWFQVQKLIDPQGEGEDDLGRTVALQGNTLLVGNPRDADVASARGAVHVFELTPSGFELRQEVRGEGLGGTLQFGRSLSLDGNHALVGTRASGSADALVWIERSAGRWLPTLIKREEEVNPHLGPETELVTFGRSVALDGDRAVVGLELYKDLDPQCSDKSSWFFAGAAVYELQGAEWTLVSVIECPDDVCPGLFMIRSYPVALSGDRFAVGNPGLNGIASGSGAVHLYQGSGSSWTLEQSLFAFGGGSSKGFGAALDLDGPRLVATRGLRDDDPGVFVFEQDGGQWIDAFQFQPSASETGDQFGTAVSADHDRLWVGAPFRASSGHPPGSTHVIDLPPSVRSSCFCGPGDGCLGAESESGCENSHGVGSLLSACGSTGYFADDLRLFASNLPADEVGILFMGRGGPPYPLGAGIGCISGMGHGRYRFPPRSTGTGLLQLGPGLVRHSLAQFAPRGRILPGSTWAFQLVYTDEHVACGTHKNSTNSVEVQFTP